MSDPTAVEPVERRPNPLVIRLGILLWLLSWFPIAELFGWTGYARLATWGVQVVIGLIGLAFAGREFAQIVKQVGWKHAPRVVGIALWRGQMPATTTTTTAAPAPTPSPVPVDDSGARRPPSRR